LEVLTNLLEEIERLRIALIQERMWHNIDIKDNSEPVLSMEEQREKAERQLRDEGLIG
jgi:hypothetical protein